jgi:hypothetical protein
MHTADVVGIGQSIARAISEAKGHKSATFTFEVHAGELFKYRLAHMMGLHPCKSDAAARLCVKVPQNSTRHHPTVRFEHGLWEYNRFRHWCEQPTKQTELTRTTLVRCMVRTYFEVVLRV